MKNLPVVACSGSWLAQDAKAKPLFLGLYPSQAQPEPWIPTAMVDSCVFKASNDPKELSMAVCKSPETKKLIYMSEGQSDKNGEVQ